MAAYSGRRDIGRARAGLGLALAAQDDWACWGLWLLSDWASAARAEARSGFGVRGRDLHEGNAFHGTWQLKAGLCGTANRQTRRGVCGGLFWKARQLLAPGRGAAGGWGRG